MRGSDFRRDSAWVRAAVFRALPKGLAGGHTFRRIRPARGHSRVIITFIVAVVGGDSHFLEPGYASPYLLSYLVH